VAIMVTVTVVVVVVVAMAIMAVVVVVRAGLSTRLTRLQPRAPLFKGP